MTSRAKWLKERRTGLGGSDIGAVVGLDPRRTALDVYLDKVEGVVDMAEGPDIESGRMLEPIIAKKYADHTGRKLFKSGLLRHPAHDFVVGTPDRRFLHESHALAVNVEGILEMKSARVAPFMRAKRDGLPAHYVAQLQWYLNLTGLALGAFALFSRELWELLDFDIEANPGLQKELMEAGIQFWFDHIEQKRPPRVGDFHVPVAVVKAGTEIVQLDTPELRGALGFYRDAKELEDAAKEARTQARQAVIDALGQQKGAFQMPGAVVHYYDVAGRTSFDKKALGAAKPLDRSKLMGALAKRLGFIDPESTEATALQEILTKDDLTMDLSQFEKVGKPSETVRIYFNGDDEEKSE